MGQYPWGFTGVTPNASDNLPDQGSFDGRDLEFTDDGALPGAPDPPLRGAGRHVAQARLRRHRRPVLGRRSRATGAPAPRPGAPADPKPSACDDGPFGNGTGGELTYTLSAAGAAARRRSGSAVAGSDQGVAAARSELARTLREPGGASWPRRSPPRNGSRSMTQLSLPGDPLVQNAVDWGKQNIADLTQSASDLQVRWTNQGKQFPAPLGHRAAGDLDRRRLSRTIRGSSAPTRSTPRSPRSRSASSRRSRATCARCATSPTCSTTGPAW